MKFHRNTIKLVTIILAILSSSANSAELVIIDGDTIIDYRESELKIRLIDIDAPEKDQPYGSEATKQLSQLLKNKTIQYNHITKDKYGRQLSKLVIDNKDINAEMIKGGHAWVWKYSKNEDYRKLMQTAKTIAFGLWQNPNAIDPSDWRKAH
jgi:micrococcal nuclease